MQILDRSVYVGPSLYAHFPVIRLELDLGALEAWPTGKLGPQYVDGLAAAIRFFLESSRAVESFGAAGRSFVEAHFNIEAQAAGLEMLYDHAVETAQCGA